MQKVSAVSIAQICFAGSLLLFAGGCRLCADCETEAYPTYGGAWQRTDREHGRVGSLFDPGGSRSAALEPRTDPESADAQIRKRENKSDAARPDDNASEGDLEQQFRDSQKPRSEAEEEKALQEMERRFEDLKLEDIRKLNVPEREVWN